MIEIPFSAKRDDQIRLQKAGGYIAVKPNGKLVFKFDSRESYKKYVEGVLR